MITNPVWQWAFTAVFAAVAARLAYRLVRNRHRPIMVIGDGLHVVMALVMIAMAWPWWAALPWAAQLVGFALATAWFLAVWLGQVLGRFEPAQLDCHPAWHQLVHALMMGAMTWMVASMPPAASHEHAGHVLSTGMLAAGFVCVALLLVSAALMVIDAATHRHGRDHLVDTVAMVAMLTGMAAMCALML